MIWTDGVFSMEGSIAKLPDILELARKHDAIVVMDDSHATGVLGKTGRGTAEHFGVLGEVDVITSTLGKALGGAAGGFIAGSDYIRSVGGSPFQQGIYGGGSVAAPGLALALVPAL